MRKKRIPLKKKVREDGKIIMEETKLLLKDEIAKKKVELANLNNNDTKPEHIDIICVFNTGKVEIETFEDPSD